MRLCYFSVLACLCLSSAGRVFAEYAAAEPGIHLQWEYYDRSKDDRSKDDRSKDDRSNDDRSNDDRSNDRQSAQRENQIDLESALLLAMERNPSIAGQHASIRAQQALLNAARYRHLPTISTFANNLNETRDQGSISVDQPLYSFGKHRSEIRLQRIKVATEELTLKEVERRVLAEVGNLYIRLTLAAETQAFAKQNVNAHRELSDLVGRRQTGGLASQADHVLAESRRLQALIELDRVTLEFSTQLVELQLLLGTGIDDLVGLDERDLITMPASLEQLRSAMRGADISVQQKSRAVELAQARLVRDQRAGLPTISLRYEREFLDDSLTNIDQERLGVVFSSSLEGLGLVNTQQAGASRHQVHAAQLDLRYSEDEIDRASSRLYEQVVVYTRTIKRAEDTLQALGAALDSARRQYTSGRGSWLELLNLQRELYQQQTDLLQARTALLLARYDIGLVLGHYDVS
ncbi:MAG: TolC family protein [Pseudomonadota bacterium]